MISSTGDPSAAAPDTGRSNGGERAGDPTGAASIDKVRDILFGNQVREFERRFAASRNASSRKRTTSRRT